MNTTTTTDIEFKWERAQALCSCLRRVPSFASSCIRAAMRQGNLTELDQPIPLQFEAKAEFLRTMAKSSSYKASLYNAARNLYPSKLVSEDVIYVTDLLDCFTPLELASLIPVVYLSRYIGVRTEDDVWAVPNLHMRKDMAIARRLAVSTGIVGPGLAMIFSSFRQLGLGICGVSDSERYTRLRNACDKRTGVPPTDAQLKFFGVENGFISATISQQFGFGVEISAAFLPRPNEQEEELPPSPREVLMGSVDFLKMGNPATELCDIYPFYAEHREELDKLDSFARRVCGDDGIYRWANSEKEDLFIITQHRIEDKKPPGALSG